MNFPIHLPSQLREHLRALRKARGLTQAALGQLLGVGQARVAEIESNPGVVRLEQLMRVLSALQASLLLQDGAVDALAASAPGGGGGSWATAPAPAPAAPTRILARQPAARYGKAAPVDVGDAPLTPAQGPGRGPKAASTATAPPLATRPRAKPIRPAPRKLVIAPKKGSW